MTDLVLDANVAVAWLFEDQARADCDELQFRVVARGALAPEIWRWEVANVWLKKSRRNRLTTREADAIRVIFGFFSSFVRREQASATAYDAAMILARRHHLSACDAAYLELALRLGLPLATLDQALQRSAAAEGVPVLPEPPADA